MSSFVEFLILPGSPRHNRVIYSNDLNLAYTHTHRNQQVLQVEHNFCEPNLYSQDTKSSPLQMALHKWCNVYSLLPQSQFFFQVVSSYILFVY